MSRRSRTHAKSLEGLSCPTPALTTDQARFPASTEPCLNGMGGKQPRFNQKRQWVGVTNDLPRGGASVR